jgi:hypothetical protein
VTGRQLSAHIWASYVCGLLNVVYSLNTLCSFCCTTRIKRRCSRVNNCCLNIDINVLASFTRRCFSFRLQVRDDARLDGRRWRLGEQDRTTQGDGNGTNGSSRYYSEYSNCQQLSSTTYTAIIHQTSLSSTLVYMFQRQKLVE